MLHPHYESDLLRGNWQDLEKEIAQEYGELQLHHL